jgi:hypothetical protein
LKFPKSRRSLGKRACGKTEWSRRDLVKGFGANGWSSPRFHHPLSPPPKTGGGVREVVLYCETRSVPDGTCGFPYRFFYPHLVPNGTGPMSHSVSQATSCKKAIFPNANKRPPLKLQTPISEFFSPHPSPLPRGRGSLFSVAMLVHISPLCFLEKNNHSCKEHHLICVQKHQMVEVINFP